MHNQLFGFEIALAAVFGILHKKNVLKVGSCVWDFECYKLYYFVCCKSSQVGQYSNVI